MGVALGFGLLVGMLALATPGRAVVCGDADGNGTVSVTDGVDVLRAAVGLGDCDPSVCDVDGNGAVTVTDGVDVLRAAAGLTTLTGCGGGSLEPRRAFLRDLVAVVALPGYVQLAANAQALEVATQTLVSTPGPDTLTLAQDAWLAARHAWKRTEAFRIGPSESLLTAARIDWSPADTAAIDAEIAGTRVFSSEYIDTLDAPKVGFQAIEYLIFDPHGGNAAVVTTLSGPNNVRRRAYLQALATNLRVQTELLRDAWEPSGGDFGTDLVNSGIGGQSFPTLAAAFDAEVDRLILTAETMEARVGGPLGDDTGGVPQPDLVETPRSGDTLGGVAADLQGIADVYLGTFQGAQGTGLSDVVAPLGADVDMEMRQRLGTATTAVDAVPTPLEDAIFSDPGDVLTADESLQAVLQALLDVANRLGVPLT